MAGKVNTKMCVAVACLVALLQISSSSAASHTVGGSGGWTNIGVDYTSWASGQNFSVGDTLVFNLQGSHTVTEVSKSDFNSCSSSSPIGTPSTANPTTITLTSGAHYYICGISGHCESGQKLAVTVGSSSTSTPSSSPSPSSSTTPLTTPSSTTTPPPPPSSAVVAGAGLVMHFLIGAAAFLM